MTQTPTTHLPISGGEAAPPDAAVRGSPEGAPTESREEENNPRSPTQSVPSRGVLHGQLMSDPSVEVLLRIESDSVEAFRPDSTVTERIPVGQMIPPAATPPPPEFSVDKQGLRFGFHSIEWSGFTVHPPVSDEWFRLAADLRDAYRRHRAAAGSEPSTEPVVENASDNVRRVWRVLPSPSQASRPES